MSPYRRLAAAHRDVAFCLERLEQHPGNETVAQAVDAAVRRLEQVRAELRTPAPASY